MPEWLQNLLIAIGGGSVVLVGILTIFKNLFLKLFEVGIETSFEKKMEKYRNRLMRSTKAYEMLLNRELQFYEKATKIFSDLATDVQDMSELLKQSEFASFDQKHSVYRDRLLNYIKQSITLKNEIIIYHPYLPDSIPEILLVMAKQIEVGRSFWYEMWQLFSAQEYEKLDSAKGDKYFEEFICSIEIVELAIKERLEELSHSKI